MGRAREAVAAPDPDRAAGGGRHGVAGILMVLGAAALWGTLGVFSKALYEVGLTPLELASIRASIGFLGLALWMARRIGALRVAWRDLPFFAAYGVLCIALFEYLYFATIEQTTISVAVALLYTAPAFVVILARLLHGEPLGRGRIASLALVLTGVFLVTGALDSMTRGEASVSRLALALGLGSGLTYGLYTIFGKSALRRYDSVRTVFWAFAFGALVLGVAAPPWQPMIRHPDALALMVMLGIFPTLVAYLLYIASLRRLSAGNASMLATAEPVVATVLGFVLLNETLARSQVLGIAVIVAAALLLARTRP